jgi:hypothetical protein
MSRRKNYLIACLAFVLIVGIAVVIFILIHREREAESGIQYKNLTNMETDTEDTQSYWSTNGHNFAKGEGGYYFTNQTANSLMFFDADTKEIIPVCAKPECSHNDSSCNAYLGSGEHLIGSVYYYRGCVYLFKTVNGNAALEQIQADGSSRKVIAEVLPNDGTGSVYVAFHDGFAYVYDHAGHLHSDTEYTEKIIEVSIENGSTRTVYEKTGVNLAIDNAKDFGGKLFFVIEQGVKNEDTGITVLKGQGLFAYDYATGNVSCISTDDIYDYYVNTDSNILYYYVNGEGLYHADMNTMESSLLYTAMAEMDMCQISYDGNYLYLNNLRWSLYKNTSWKNVECIVMDTNGKVVNEIPCSNFLHIYYGDSNYMFALKPGEGAMNGLVYIDKKEITTVKEWTRLSETEIEIYNGH